MSLTSRLQALLTYANDTTGQADTTLGDAVRTLAAGYGGGAMANVATAKYTPTVNIPYNQAVSIPISGMTASNRIMAVAVSCNARTGTARDVITLQSSVGLSVDSGAYSYGTTKIIRADGTQGQYNSNGIRYTEGNGTVSLVLTGMSGTYWGSGVEYTIAVIYF